MDKLSKYVEPAAVAAVVLWAYHNGHLNFLFSEPSKAGIITIKPAKV